jgi:hypothetical protein
MPDAGELLRRSYLDLIKGSLLMTANGPLTVHLPVSPSEGSWARRVLQRALLRRGGVVLASPVVYAPADDEQGRRPATVLPPGIKTMIGRRRLDNVERLLVDVIERGVEGDVIETGVWRGGTTILMKAILDAYGEAARSVYVADSFEGLPPPDAARYPADEGLDLYRCDALAVGLDEVRASFEQYGLLDDRVVFVKGWFRDTLPGLVDHRWSLIRLDGDLYESTMDGLENLYPGLAPGGWVIIDDYAIEACAQAVSDYRTEHAITEPMDVIDWTGRCWRKEQ